MGYVALANELTQNADDAKAVKKHYLKNAIAQYTAKEKISESETKSVGCGIKFVK